ncbi:TPR-like protein [Pluteus cervinus]|uniref:TPR-like protein n=1 Tax=Pluteus cervinus TaxID=181527 RepID=A0ACD3AVY1_9AGAR|nr:TPR-like protein [Pluteus cervinus]
MSKPLAQSSKEKGNAAFKAGDYPTAIGHYTAAILADPNDITFPLNRAAAYLKLGKYQDAERDCSTVLAKDSKNVKALFRRGQSRIGLEDYETGKRDLTQALTLEPDNDAVKGELARVDSLEKNSRKVLGTAAQPPKRRRVPIQIIEAPSSSAIVPKPAAQGSEDSLKPVSSRRLNTPKTTPDTTTPTAPEPPSQATPPPAPKSFVEAKQAREATKTTRVGGGIFRPSGQHTIFQTRDLPAKTAASETRPRNAPTKMTLFNFTRSWERATQQERWDLLLTLIPSSLPSMIQTSLEPTTLVGILETLHWALDNDPTSPQLVESFMLELTKVPRFKTVALFLSGTERQCVTKIWSKLEPEPVGDWKAIV